MLEHVTVKYAKIQDRRHSCECCQHYPRKKRTILKEEIIAEVWRGGRSKLQRFEAVCYRFNVSLGGMKMQRSFLKASRVTRGA